MPVCSVLGCSNRSARKSTLQKNIERRRKITFHAFPKDLEIRNAWLKAIGRLGWNPSRGSVCSEHFPEDSFDRTSLVCVRLRESAISTILRPAHTDSVIQHPLQVDGISPLAIAGPSFQATSSSNQQQHTPIVIAGSSAESSSNNHQTDEAASSNQQQKIPIAIAGSSAESSSNTQQRGTALSKRLRTSVLSQSKQKRILTISRTTSFSPLRRMTRQISPTKSALLNKIKEIDKRYKMKIKLLQQRNRRHIKKIATMSSVLRDLKTQNFLQEDQLIVLKNISDCNKEILKRQIAQSSGSGTQRQYSEELRKFAITLHYYSPSAYNYVRSAFNSCLPHPKTISKWYKSVDGAPGFTYEAFQALKIRSQYSDNTLLCSLCVDEMAIRRQIEFDGKRYYGYVEYGVENDDDTVAQAKDVLVFLIVCINDSWKVPVAYFPVDGVSAEQRCNLVNICLSKCHEAGIRVVSLTFDGAASNMSMMSRLFYHPDTKDKIYFFPDPSHMLKNVRNAFHDHLIFYDANNKQINWTYITQLQQLQDSEGLHLANKLRNTHVNYKRQVMKVRLATQLLSESVACALEFCCNELQLPNFKDISGTVDFIRCFNNLFDILNSKNSRQRGLKAPLSRYNIRYMLSTLEKCENYISSLKNKNNSLVITSNRKTGFIGFLICINSLKNLYTDLVENNSLLLYIPTYKLSQDHLEMLFSSIRARGGFNNNPTVRQFSASYKRLLVHMELQTSLTGNCIPLENINILHIPSSTKIKTNAVAVINNSLNMSRIDLEGEEQQDIISVLQDFDHNYQRNPQELTEYAENVISYISGFVVRHLKKVIHCEECVEVLEESERSGHVSNNNLSLINVKNKGGLLYPSSSVQNICKIAEKVIRQALLESGGIHLKKKFSILYLVTSVLHYYQNKNIFENLSEHANDQNPMENHIIYLIKAISEKYISIRLYYIAKNIKDSSQSRRQQYNKLILFEGY